MTESRESWDELKQMLLDERILWDLPKKDDLEKGLPAKTIQLINAEVSRGIVNEIRDHWRAECDDITLNSYDPSTIAHCVGLKAQELTNDFDQIIRENSESDTEKRFARIYISEIVFEEEDLKRPWERDDFYYYYE